MECIALLLYLLLRQALDLYYEYKRAKLKEPPPPVNTTAIGFEIPPVEIEDDEGTTDKTKTLGRPYKQNRPL
jgi:hypothetical protein